jgi:head-tail adaptor
VIGAGDLRDRVGFYQREGASESPDYGNTIGDFETEASLTVAANIKPRLGGEAVLAGRLEGRKFVSITIRRSVSSAEITEDWRAKDERVGTIFNIRSVIDPYQHTADRNKWIELLCEEGVAT